MTEEERMQFYRGFILWQQEGLDINKYHCLFINFGVNMSLQYPQIRRDVVIIEFSGIFKRTLLKVLVWLILYFMTSSVE